jgi:hypothetical protein
MSFYTEIQIPEFPWKIDHSKRTLLMGSCFSENIGQQLLDRKFQADVNPFGILYNPESVANGLKILLESRPFQANDLFYDQGLWNSFYHHGRFSAPDPVTALVRINDRIEFSSEFLKKADFLIVTFGTAWVYELKETGQIVSNCHKVQASGFKRFRLGVYEITETWKDILEAIWKLNPNLKVIFTVSPIRHWKDGAVENQVSKAVLLLAIDQLKKGFGGQRCGYFPSYEIMMDELRDYRFYADDMLHPSPVAIGHIYGRFSRVAISSESQSLSKKVIKIGKSLAHRIANPGSEAHLAFLESTLQKLRQLTNSFPMLDFAAEKARLEDELEKFKKMPKT